jgi:O-antigen ligase
MPRNDLATRIFRQDGGISIFVSISILLGVYLQIGENRFAPNILFKILGISLPVFFAALVLLLQKSANRGLTVSKIEIVWIFLFIGSMLFQYLNTSNMTNFLFGAADRNLGLITFGILLSVYFLGKYLSRFDLKFLISCIVLIAFLQSLIVLFQRYLKPDVQNDAGFQQTPSVFGTFYNSNPLSLFLGVSCSALFVFILNSNLSKLISVGAWLVFAITLSGLMVSGSSQGLIGFAGTLLIYLAKKHFEFVNKRFSLLLPLVYGFALLAFFIIIMLVPLSSTSNITTNPYLERLEIYKSAVSMFLQHPFSGVGVDSFASEYGKFTISTDLKLVDNAHSIILHVLSTQGLIVALLFLVFTFSVLRINFDNTSPRHAQVSFFQSAFFAFMLIGIVGIDHPTISFLAFLSAGIVSGIGDAPERKKNFQVSIRAIAAVLLVINSLIAIVVVPTTIREFRVSKALTDLSTLRISPERFKAEIVNEFDSISNSRLLLNLGQAFIALDDRQGAKEVALELLRNFPQDQRTSALLFAIAEKWSDAEAYQSAVELRNQLFPQSADS